MCIQSEAGRINTVFQQRFVTVITMHLYILDLSLVDKWFLSSLPLFVGLNVQSVN